MLRHIVRTLISAAVLAVFATLISQGFLSHLTETASARGTPDRTGLPLPLPSPSPGPAPGTGAPASFTFCGGSSMTDCVIDGDTFRYRGDKIRIADIDTPELHPPRCAYEKALGEAAKQRLLELLNSAPFDLKTIDRDTDRYGRKLRVVVRAGQSVGDTLVAEGLARTWEGRRRSWCD